MIDKTTVETLIKENSLDQKWEEFYEFSGQYMQTTHNLAADKKNALLHDFTLTLGEHAENIGAVTIKEICDLICRNIEDEKDIGYEQIEDLFQMIREASTMIKLFENDSIDKTSESGTDNVTPNQTDSN